MVKFADGRISKSYIPRHSTKRYRSLPRLNIGKDERIGRGVRCEAIWLFPEVLTYELLFEALLREPQELPAALMTTRDAGKRLHTHVSYVVDRMDSNL